MRFVKMHGLGNDFIVVGEPIDLDAEEVSALCDRRFGIGADGLLAVGRRPHGVTMRYWNADGTPAEMCGNGLRCVARYAVDEGLVDGPEFVVETPVGERSAVIDDNVTVEMGPVTVHATSEIADGVRLRRVWVGNPHAVIEVDEPSEFPVAEVGSRLQRDPLFPDGVNVEFVARSGPGVVRMRVWERGVGETLACGTGMVAAAAVERERSGHTSVEVAVPGGAGVVAFDGDSATLTGPAVTVFRGDWVLTGPGGAPRPPSR